MADNLTQIKELLEIIKHKVDLWDFSMKGQGSSVNRIKEQLSVVNSKLDEHSTEIKSLKKEIKNTKGEITASEKRLSSQIKQLSLDIGDTIRTAILPIISDKDKKDGEQDERLDRIESVPVVALELKKPSKKH